MMPTSITILNTVLVLMAKIGLIQSNFSLIRVAVGSHFILDLAAMSLNLAINTMDKGNMREKHMSMPIFNIFISLKSMYKGYHGNRKRMFRMKELK